MIPADILGTIPGWITSAGVLALLGLLLRSQIANRRLGMESRVIDNTAAGVAGELYAKEVAALRERLDQQDTRFQEKIDSVEKKHTEAMAAQEKRHNEAMAESEKRHEECLSDRDGLRGEVSVLRNEINGMVRVITQASIDRVVVLGDAVPDDIRQAAARAQILINEEAKKS